MKAIKFLYSHKALIFFFPSHFSQILMFLDEDRRFIWPVTSCLHFFIKLCIYNRMYSKNEQPNLVSLFGCRKKTWKKSNLSIDFKAGFVLTQSTVQINLNIHTTPDTTWNPTRTGSQSCTSSCGAGGTPYSNDTNLHLTRLSHHNTLTSKCNKTWPLNHTYTHTQCDFLYYH